MPASIEELRPYLQASDFSRVYSWKGLGWDHYLTEQAVVRVDERNYTTEAGR